MKIYRAKILYLNDDDETDVSVEVDGMLLTCFMGYRPPNIEIGNVLSATFTSGRDDNYSISKIDCKKKKMERIDDSFSYWVSGYLCDGVLDCGIEIEDSLFLSEWEYLDRCYVKMKIEQLDIDFVS